MTTDQRKGELFRHAHSKAIQAERESNPSTIELRVLEVKHEHPGCRIVVGKLGLTEDDGKIFSVEDRFDNAHIRWREKGQTVQPLTVKLDPDRANELIVSGVSAADLQGVKTVELQCYDFHLMLKRAWQNNHFSAKAFDSYNSMGTPRMVDTLNLSEEPGAERLSSSQIGALNLVNQAIAYLWGPPGTGKTQTCAVMLMTYLTAKPESKILVLGIANIPVDQLLIRLDNLLKDHGRNDIRSQITRYGGGVSSEICNKYYHLNAGDQDEFMPAYGDLRQFRMTDSELGLFDANQKSTRLLAMTISTATHKIEKLRLMAPFDLVLIEEASQAALTQVLLFAPLATSIIYSGDPAQLAPVATCQRPEVHRWMGNSAFDRMPDLLSPNVWMLTEQRRMAPSICRLVSAIGYKDGLTTSPECLNQKRWNSDRHQPFGRYRAGQNLIAHQIFQSSHQLSGKLVREESGQEILKLLQENVGGKIAQKDIFVVTPFRAQAAYLRRLLDTHHFNEVRVSTVHKTQGKEARIVIFDPVDGTHNFLKSKEALKLLTVAFSRAECKLIVMLSERDLENPILRKAQEMADECETEYELI